MGNYNAKRNNRQSWLTAYRIMVTAGVLALVVMSGFLLGRSFTPISVEQATKVEQGAEFLETIGFNSPIYQGIQPGAEGEYPTYTATAIGGESIEIWVRTSPDGSMTIQPVGYFGGDIDSAYDLARYATEVTYTWEHAEEKGLEPRTDSSYGEYESAKYDFEKFSKYDVDDLPVWDSVAHEVEGWPVR